jgi:hypothetical protein
MAVAGREHAIAEGTKHATIANRARVVFSATSPF